MVTTVVDSKPARPAPDAAAIFNEALEKGPAEREQFLAEACAADSSLREEVDSLLAAYELTPGFVENGQR